MAYLEGRGVAADPVQAFEWLAKAAEQGHPKAQFQAGILLVEGRGVRRDPVEGTKWLLLSTYAGGPMARAKVPSYVEGIPRPQYREAQARARAWRSERGLPVPEPKKPEAAGPVVP
jgi:TPR repeat protein